VLLVGPDERAIDRRRRRQYNTPAKTTTTTQARRFLHSVSLLPKIQTAAFELEQTGRVAFAH
jgi:hypothetical protein